MANYISSLTGSEMDTALGALNEIYPVDGIVKGDGEGGFEAVDVDTTPTQSSTNLVSSGGVFTALDGKASKSDLGTISLTTNWTGSSSPYTQTVTVTGATITSNSKVDIQPNATTLAQLITDGVNALYIENNDGTLTCYSIGNKPSVALNDIQVLVSEVAL